MPQSSRASALILGLFLFFGLSTLGYILGNAAIEYKEFERTVTVKGLSEREYDADIVIWPIQFTSASNDPGQLYRAIETNTSKIQAFLAKKGISSSEITISAPAIPINLLRNMAIITMQNFAIQQCRR